MNDEAAFLHAMQENPDDNALRLVFADWLEARGDQRGELIRLLHTLTQSIKVRGRKKLEDRLRALLASGVQPVGPFWTNSIGMKFAWIPAGTFLMGSPAKEAEREDNEIQHRVTLTEGFYLAIHPVTQASWQKIMGNNPSQTKGKTRPVEQVSWDDCQEFLRQSSEREGHAYRLPTEAEWEYACRAGTTTPFSFGETIFTDQANFDGSTDPYPYGRGKQGLGRGKTIPVGSFSANGWGLHDMHGNVSEWCADWYEDYPQREALDPRGPQSGDTDDRVMRGGSFLDPAMVVRSAYRNWFVSSDHFNAIGFRVARTVAP